MKKYKWIIILLNLLVILAVFNSSVVSKEGILSKAKLILLELAPVDPRSLMQGDYMELRYKITTVINVNALPPRGFCVVKIDNNGVGSGIRFQKGRTPLADEEYLIEYTRTNWNLKIGAESYFFEEGQSKKFEKAKYGGLKVDQKGNSLLIGLFDENLKKIE